MSALQQYCGLERTVPQYQIHTTNSCVKQQMFDTYDYLIIFGELYIKAYLKKMSKDLRYVLLIMSCLIIK